MIRLLVALACFGLGSFSEAQDFAHKKVDSHTGAHASKAPVTTAEFETIHGVEKQPLAAAAERVIEALQYIGAPMMDADVAKLKATMRLANDREAVTGIQEVLDPLCLAQVTINAESRVSAIEGNVPKKLIQQGWVTFLIKANNAARITRPLVVTSPQAGRTYKKGTGAPRPQLLGNLVAPEESDRSFLDIEVYGKQPLRPNLSGLEVEYRIVQLFSRDKGRREATLGFHVGQGNQDLGFRSDGRRQAGARQQAERRMVHQGGRAMLEPKRQRNSQRRTCRSETGV